MSTIQGAVTQAGSPSTREPVTTSSVATNPATPGSVAPIGAAPVSPAYDYYNPDTWGDKDPHTVVKEIQAAHDKKVTELTESNKSTKSELEHWQSEYDGLIKEAEGVLKNEDLYHQYREKLGLKRQSMEVIPPPTELIKQLPNVELTPDMSLKDAQDRFNKALSERDKFHLDYTKKAVSEALDSFKTEIYKEVGNSMKPMHQAKWKSAMDTAIDKYGPSIQEIRPKLVAYIDGPYSHLYNGNNESDLIEKVFRAEFPDNFAKYVISKQSQEAKVISDAATATSTTHTDTLPTDNSPASCIARANARVEASLRAKGLI